MSEERPDERAPKLAYKLAEVMAAVKHIPKRGRNEFHKYDYATEADIVGAIRHELADRHVMLIPAVLDSSREAIGDKGSYLTTLRMSFTFMDGESGEHFTRLWAGFGTDKDDKGGYKAMTGGEKYFLLKTFLIPTGDDPEVADHSMARKTARDSQEPLVVLRTGPAAGGPSPAPSQRQAPELPAPLQLGPPVITKKQRDRMFAIAEQHGWKTHELKALVARHGFESSKYITRAVYDTIILAIEEGVSAPTGEVIA